MPLPPSILGVRMGVASSNRRISCHSLSSVARFNFVILYLSARSAFGGVPPSRSFFLKPSCRRSTTALAAAMKHRGLIQESQ